VTAPWGALALILLALAVVTAAATSVRSVSRIWLRHWAERRLAGSAAAEMYIERPQRLLHGASVGAAFLVSVAGLLIGGSAAAGWGVTAQVAAFALAMLVLAQHLPRAIGRRWSTSLVPWLLPVLRALSMLAHPLLWTAQMASRAVSREESPSAPTQREEIEDLLREGELEGIGEREEIDIITDVLEFGEKRLHDVMTPRTNVFALDVEMDPREMARAVAQAGYSRVPVYRGTLDEIVGIVHALDVLKTGGEDWPPLRQAAFAPEAKRCSEMLFEMLRGQRHIAVVLDEFGGTAGIVTLEDVLEELVGDIRDEHDEPAALAAAGAPGGSPPRALFLPGATELGELSERFGVGLDGGRQGAAAHTVGGALARALGRIPGPGERFRVGPLEVTVVEADATRVASVLVQRAESAAVTDVSLTG
jgi:putative hemolysin